MNEEDAKTKQCPLRVIVYNLEKIAGNSDVVDQYCAGSDCIFWRRQRPNDPDSGDCALAPRELA